MATVKLINRETGEWSDENEVSVRMKAKYIPTFKKMVENLVEATLTIDDIEYRKIFEGPIH